VLEISLDTQEDDGRLGKKSCQQEKGWRRNVEEESNRFDFGPHSS
jgi:hypothetical protein